MSVIVTTAVLRKSVVEKNFKKYGAHYEMAPYGDDTEVGLYFEHDDYERTPISCYVGTIDEFLKKHKDTSGVFLCGFSKRDLVELELSNDVMTIPKLWYYLGETTYMSRRPDVVPPGKELMVKIPFFTKEQIKRYLENYKER